MNKPLRALLAVIVLAFAAAGLYYAWFAPTKPALEKLDVRKQTGPKVAADEGKPLEDIKVQSTLAPAAPISVSASSAPSAPSFAPATAVPSSTPSNIPAGFVPDNAPMQPLPSNLPGFTPATASGVVVGTAVAGQASSATAPTTVSSTFKGGAPSSSSATKSVGTAPSPATIAPVPSSGVDVGATSSTAGKFQTPTPSATPATSPSVVPSSSSTNSASGKTSATATPAATVHVVAAGDTLTSIAKQYWGTSQGWENIVKANPGLSPSTLKIGAKLNIPAKDAVIVKTTTAPATSGATVAGAAQDYEVVSGDTLSQISNKVYGDSKHWNLIYEANKKVIGADPADLVVGTKLTIPAKPQAGAKTATPTNTKSTLEAKPIAIPASTSKPGSTNGTSGASVPMSTPSTTAPITKPNTTPSTLPSTLPSNLPGNSPSTTPVTSPAKPS
jgi:nucleoid-associated protein YgaU